MSFRQPRNKKITDFFRSSSVSSTSTGDSASTSVECNDEPVAKRRRVSLTCNDVLENVDLPQCSSSIVEKDSSVIHKCDDDGLDTKRGQMDVPLEPFQPPSSFKFPQTNGAVPATLKRIHGYIMIKKMITSSVTLVVLQYNNHW